MRLNPFGSGASRRALAAEIAALNRSTAVISFALDGTILDANENFLKAMGYTLDQVRGRHHSIFVTKEEAASAEYKAYAAGLEADPELWCRWSERYINWRQLEVLGLMSRGNWA